MASNGRSASTARLTAEAAAHLQEGVNLVFSQWGILQNAVGWRQGGANSLLKSQQLAHGLFSLLTRSQVYLEDVMNFLGDGMSTHFGIINMDGVSDSDSLENVALSLMYVREGCFHGDFSLVQRHRATGPPTRAVSHDIKAYSESDDDNDSGDENLVCDASSMLDLDVPPACSVINRAQTMVGECKSQESAEAEAEFGWTVVASKRTKCRRN